MSRCSKAILNLWGGRSPKRPSLSSFLPALCVATTISLGACGRSTPVSDTEATPAARKVLGLGQEYDPERVTGDQAELPAYVRGQITHYYTFDSVGEHLGGTQ